jgi:hypothetical protein
LDAGQQGRRGLPAANGSYFGVFWAVHSTCSQLFTGFVISGAFACGFLGFSIDGQMAWWL